MCYQESLSEGASGLLVGVGAWITALCASRYYRLRTVTELHVALIMCLFTPHLPTPLSRSLE